MLLAVLCAASGASAATHDVLVDFSGTSNPNGVWSFGHSNGLTGAMTLYADKTTASNAQWWYDANHISLGAPSVWKHDDGYIAFHPGPVGLDNYSIIRWTAPTTETVELDVSFLSIDGGNKDVFVYHDGDLLHSATIAGSQGTAKDATLNVLAGDQLFVAVGRANDDFQGDSTRVAFSVNVIPEPASMAVLTLGAMTLLRRRRR